MRLRDRLAFALLFAIVQGVALFVGFFVWQSLHLPLWAGVAAALGLALLIGIYFAHYAYASIEERNKELADFVSETLHELNIPVATIKANLQLLKKCDPKKIGRIALATAQLQRLYHDLELFIKGSIQKEYTTFDAAALVQERLEIFKDLLKERDVILDLDESVVRLPRYGFARVIDNLLANAVKFTHPGGRIAVTLREGRLCIADSGEGMSEEELCSIFERYYSGASTQKGHGIGLAIVKRFCDEEGIDVRITSQKMHGTTVCLDLRRVKV